MKEERYVAAIEIGSFKITGAVGLYSPENDSLKILAVEQTPSRDSVRYGIIQNPEEAATRISRLIERLELNPAVAPNKITGVFVGLSGRSMHSIAKSVKIDFPEEVEVTEEMLRNLKRDALSDLGLDSTSEILDTVPRSYHIDGLDTTSPKGAMVRSIKASYDFIVGRTEIKRNIMRAVSERCGLEVKGLVVTALAAAGVVLSDEEKGLGCMLVDMGAETTSVSIYRKGALCYYATIPLGGRNITRDLTSLSILEEKAEEIKIESGRAVASETPSTLVISGLKLIDVSNLVVARAEEIVANVIQQIFYANLKEKDLPGGIVCIGAGSNLNGLIDLISYQSGLNVRRGNLAANIVPGEQKAKRLDAIEVAGILYAGARTGIDGCLEAPEAEVPDNTYDDFKDSEDDDNASQTPRRGFFYKLGNKISNIFAPPTDDDSELE